MPYQNWSCKQIKSRRCGGQEADHLPPPPQEEEVLLLQPVLLHTLLVPEQHQFHHDPPKSPSHQERKAKGLQLRQEDEGDGRDGAGGPCQHNHGKLPGVCPWRDRRLGVPADNARNLWSSERYIGKTSRWVQGINCSFIVRYLFIYFSDSDGICALPCFADGLPG